MNAPPHSDCMHCAGTKDHHAPDCITNSAMVPTVWRTQDGRAVEGTSPIVPPDDDDVKMLESAYEVCGTCVYFELLEGQRRMRAQRFIERLVREDKWQVKHLVSPLNELGLCGAYDSGSQQEQTITGKITKACNQYRHDKGRVRSRLRVLK